MVSLGAGNSVDPFDPTVVLITVYRGKRPPQSLSLIKTEGSKIARHNHASWSNGALVSRAQRPAERIGKKLA